MLGALVGVRILTELLNPSIYGELALGMTVATFINQMFFVPIATGIIRFYAPAVEQGSVKGYFEASRRLVLFATGGIILLIPLIALILLVIGRVDWIALAVAALIWVIPSGYNSILSGIQNAARQRRIVAGHKVMETWMRYLIAALLIKWFGPQSAVVFCGYIIAVTITFISQYLFFRKIVLVKVVHDNQKKFWTDQIVKYSRPVGSWSVFTWAQNASDKWALNFFTTTQSVGLYAVLYQVGVYPIMVATGLLTQFLGPIFFQRAGDGSDAQRNSDVTRLCSRLIVITLSMTVIVCVLGLLYHNFVFQLLVGERYSSVSYLLGWVMLAGGLFATGQIVSLGLMSRMETEVMKSAKILTAIVGVVLHFIGAYFYGLEGVVFAGVLFSASYAIWMILLSIKKRPVASMPNGNEV